MIKARIYKPARNAMQSGNAATKKWILEFAPEEKKAPDPLMGWAGSGDMQSQIRLKFKTCEEAEDYAKRKGLSYTILKAHSPKPIFKTYADNFK